jgi:hypothetical protein
VNISGVLHIANSVPKLRTVNKILRAELKSMDERIKVQWETEEDGGGTQCSVSDIRKEINGNKMPPPSFYHRLYAAKSLDYVEDALRRHIEPLLENNLTHTPQKLIEVSERYFLCVTISDKKLPWDITKTESWIASVGKFSNSVAAPILP